jgi:hypothetical protein
MSATFISYRRNDSGYAGRVADRLCQEFGRQAVFRDVDAIESGTRFPETISKQLDDCRVFVLMIGPGWIGFRGESQSRSLDHPNDWVRIEIATALRRAVCIIPVTVGGAPLPAAHELPDDLNGLADWQGRDLRDGDTWNGDLELLVRRIAKELGFRTRQSRQRVIATITGLAMVALITAAAAIFFYRPLTPLPAAHSESPSDIVFFDNTNDKPVANNPPQPTYLTISRPYFVTSLITYHWNGGEGAPPGKISLRRSGGVEYGPWESRGIPGNGNVQNASWMVEPRVTLPPGKYEVVDSKRATWSHNAGSKGEGFVFIRGHPR